MLNIKDTILSQYANSPAMLALINSMNDAIDPQVNIDDFYAKMWNITTAIGYGLDVWGRIVGVSRILHVPNTFANFGFTGPAPNGYKGFNQAKLYNGVASTTNYALVDDAFRALILVKALSNISRTSIGNYNHMLMALFPGRGKAYISDNGTMHATLTFEFLLQPFEISILKQSGAFANPTGVKFDIMDVNMLNTFGFSGPSANRYKGFNHGTLFKGFE
jgi:hypothetical protein